MSDFTLPQLAALYAALREWAVEGPHTVTRVLGVSGYTLPERDPGGCPVCLLQQQQDYAGAFEIDALFRQNLSAAEITDQLRPRLPALHPMHLALAVEAHAEQHVIVGALEPALEYVPLAKYRPETRKQAERDRLRPPGWGRASAPKGRLVESRPEVWLPWPWQPEEERRLITLMAAAPDPHRERLTRIRTAPDKGPGSLPSSLLREDGRLLSQHDWRAEDSRDYLGSVAWLGVKLGRGVA